MSRTEIKDKGSGGKKSEWFGYKYRVTPETSKLLQEAVFKDGGAWGNSREVKYTEMEYIFVKDNGDMTFSNDGNHFDRHSLPEKQPPQPIQNFYTAYVTFPNSYIYEEYAYKINYEQYKLIADKDNVILNVDVGGTIKKVNLVRLSNHLDPKATKEIYGIEGYSNPSKSTLDSVVKVDLQNANNTCVSIERGNVVATSSETNGFKPNNFINQQEETNMSNANNRRIVTVQVFDLDAALDVEHSLVHVFKDVVTEDTNDVTLTELLHTGQLVEPLAVHNKTRTAQDNKDILARTGKKVKLEPVKVKNLSFKYV